jgi:cell shape-determining protein MreD
VVKDFLIWLGIGLLFLVVQSTWFYGEEINPFRLDLVFVVVILLGGLNRLGMGVAISAFLGMIVDILSWDLLGLTMTLYPLLFLVCHFVASRTNLQPLWFQTVSIFVLQAIYGILVLLFLKTSLGVEVSRIQVFFVFVQAFITTLIALPVTQLQRVFLKKGLPLH